MSIENYYDRFEMLWESVGCKSANEFALRLGFDKSEKIRRLKPDRAENKKQQGKINLPGIEIIEAILKKYPQIDARWLITGKGKMIIETESSVVNFEENNKISKVEEPCPFCEKLKADKMKLLEKLDRKRDELDKLNEDYRRLLETGIVKKETTSSSDQKAG